MMTVLPALCILEKSQNRSVSKFEVKLDRRGIEACY